MFKTLSGLSFAIVFASSHAFAGDCVKVRNGNDGYDCMKFSQAENRKASKYGLRLGTPYAKVRQQLAKAGWSVDPKWMEEQSMTSPAKEGVVCGSGWDAVCSTAFRKNKTTISILLSGSNAGMPLIGVDTEPEH